MTFQREAVTIDLYDIDALFAAPDLDPMRGRTEMRSGIDQIEAVLRAHPVRGQVHAVVRLPADQIDADLPARANAALRRFGDARIAALDADSDVLRYRSHRALTYGLSFLALSLLIASLADRARFLPEFLRHFFSEGFIIIGWVALWAPMELVFERLPLRRERQRAEQLRDMNLTIVPQP
jgi:hypothetical protein